MFSLPATLVALAITGAGSGQTVLLDFYSDACGPCRQMMPTVDQLAAQGNPVQRVNVAQYPDLARRFRVTNIPCFVMVVNDREAGRVVGATSLGRLEQLCSLGRPAPAPNTMIAGAAAPQPGASIPVVPVSYAPPAARMPVNDADMLAASVRLRVEDPQGHSCGSGTIIDALPGGEALVLTCGHLFRDSQGQGKVEVDVFGPAPAAHLVGRVVSFDLERDVAFVAFRPQGAVTVARVAPRGYSMQPGDAVTTVGCDHGDDPTVQHSRINRLDRFQDAVEKRLGHKILEPHAPWSVQVAGQPVVGRSGGGLFSADGMVIGVCNAAEPEASEGLFAALGTIHAALDQQRLTSLYQQPIAPPLLVRAANDTRQSIAAADPFAAARNGAPPNASVASTIPRAANAGSTGLSGAEQTTLDEIHRKLREGSELIVIVHDRNDPKSPSQVFTLNEASPIFVNQLARAAQAPVVKHYTSMEISKRRTPILEWDAEAGWLHQNPLPR
jgi:thiol-disulfide isomerase/thioredoxin